MRPTLNHTSSKAFVPWPCDGQPAFQLPPLPYPGVRERPGDRCPGESVPALRSPLSAVSPAAAVMGFRSFDLDELSEGDGGSVVARSR